MKSRTLRSVLVVAFGCLASAAMATTVIRQDTRGLARSSSDIVVGRVASVRSHWDEGHRHIYTDVDFEVLQSLKGARARLLLTQLGGEVDGYRLTVPGCPVFERGEEALVFAWRDAHGVAQVNGLGQGKFEIRRDPKTGEAFLGRAVPGMAFQDVRTLAPLKAGAEPGRIPLTRMLDQIRSALQSPDN